MAQGNISEFCATLWLKKPALTLADPQLGSLPEPSEAWRKGESRGRKGISFSGQLPEAITAAAWWNKRDQGREWAETQEEAVYRLYSFSSYFISLKSSCPTSFMEEGLENQKTQTPFSTIGPKYRSDLESILYFLSLFYN